MFAASGVRTDIMKLVDKANFTSTGEIMSEILRAGSEKSGWFFHVLTLIGYIPTSTQCAVSEVHTAIMKLVNEATFT